MLKDQKPNIYKINLHMDLSSFEIVGHGGTKTAFAVSKKAVVVAPNGVDGKALMTIWQRIINEEMHMSSRLQALGVPCLHLEPCKIVWGSQRSVMPSYISRAFGDYLHDDVYIVDTKCLASTTWPHDKSVLFFGSECKANCDCDFELWRSVLEPVLSDVKTLVRNGIALESDSLNIAIVGSKSEWHNQNPLTPYQIRLFAFDFSSKHHTLDPVLLKADEKLSSGLFMLDNVVRLALWEVLAPKKISFPMELQTLCTALVKSMELDLKIASLESDAS
jgi:hypothetical protein